MGLPGAGKSTAIRTRFEQERAQLAGVDVCWIDSDVFKQRHPDYDPENPGALHEWSVQESLKAFAAALVAPSPIVVVVDGTGAAAAFTDRIREAKAAGFTVELFVVDTPVTVCAKRLEARVRRVPYSLLEAKRAGIAANFGPALSLADRLIRVNGVTGATIE